MSLIIILYCGHVLIYLLVFVPRFCHCFEEKTHLDSTAWLNTDQTNKEEYLNRAQFIARTIILAAGNALCICVNYTERLCCSQAKIQPLTASEHSACSFIEILYPSVWLSGGHNTVSSWAAPAPSPTALFVHLHFHADETHYTLTSQKDRTANKLSISQTFSIPD